MGNFLYVIKEDKRPLFKKGSIIPINNKQKDYGYNYYSKKKIYNNNNVKTKNKG